MRIIIVLFFIFYAFLLSAQQKEREQPVDTLTIDEAVVTGSRIEVSRSTMPVNVTVLSSEDINEVEESAVLPVLSRKVPGLFLTESGVIGFGVGDASAGRIMVRGVGGAPNTQVMTLVDGQPQYMGIFGHPLPNSYVASDLERVEVIRGPASILYGSNAMGGVINFITKKQKEEGFSGNARMSYGSFNTYKLMANGGFNKNGFNVFASFNRDVTDGHRVNSSFEINNAFVKADYALNEHFTFSADYNIAVFNDVDPGADFVTDAEPFVSDIIRGKTSFSVKNDYERIKGGLVAFLNFGDHELSSGWQSVDETIGLTFYQGITLPYNTQLTAGVDYKQVGGRGNQGLPANANVWNELEETGVYTLLRHRFFDALNLSYGVRLENNSMYGTEWVPQAGLAWSVNPTTVLKASVSKGFRSPTVMETYLFLPNPDLQPERMLSYEAGLSKAFFGEQLIADLSVFLIEGSNIIQVVPNPNAPPPMQRLNTGEFRNSGFEVELSYFPVDLLSIDLSYSYLNTETPLLAAPEHMLYAGASYRWDRFRFALQNQFVGGLYSYVHNPMANETAANDIIQDYFLVNASVGWKPAQFAEVFVSGKNLLNQTYQIKNGYPMPGIHFMTGVNFSF